MLDAKKTVGFVTLLLFSAGAGAKTDPAAWGKVKAPFTASPAQSFGGYVDGCVLGAQALPLQGPGHFVMRAKRRRNYSHPRMIAWLESLGQLQVKNKWGKLLIGDLSQPMGGPLIGGHRSHQSGLDADIWFRRAKPGQKLNAGISESWEPYTMIDTKKKSVNGRWSETEEKILQSIALEPHVERIFVHALIKAKLCERYPQAQNAWQKKIRPWWSHHYHFHVRMFCPEDSKGCRPQDPVPDTDECEGLMARWFDPKTGAMIPPPPDVDKTELTLPEECEAALKEQSAIKKGSKKV